MLLFRLLFALKINEHICSNGCSCVHVCVCVFALMLQQMEDSTKFIDLDVDDVFSSYELFSIPIIFIRLFIIL